MKKRKIAVFVNGFCNEIIGQFFKGLKEELEGKRTDVYIFCPFPNYIMMEGEIRGELNLFNLPELKDFDIAMIAANGLDYIGIYDVLLQKCEEAGVPFISIARNHEKGHFVTSDNVAGTKALTECLIDELGCRDIAFIAGCDDNQDSNIRLATVREVMESRGLRLSDDKTRLCHSNWEDRIAIEYVRDVVKKGCIPQAIICANDELAMACCSELGACHVKVPEDVKVTGFDNAYFSKIFDPAIASVNQRFDLVGKACARIALDVFDGKTERQEVVVPSEFVPGESIGQMEDDELDGLRRQAGKNFYTDSADDTAFSRKVAEIERRIKSSDSYEKLHDGLTIAYDMFSVYEQFDFHILLDERFRNSIQNMCDDFRDFEYSDSFDVVYSREDGHVYEPSVMPKRQLIPHLKETQENRFFLFVPIHEYEKTFGYMVLCDRLDLINFKNDLCRYAERVSVSLDRWLQSLKLRDLNAMLLELSQTDPLTRVKNRNAYEKMAQEYDGKMQEGLEDGGFSVAVFDVNNLKKINDVYGHEKGDEYIVNACEMLCRAYKHSPVYRIGGDEFVILLAGEDREKRFGQFGELMRQMAELKKGDRPITERISIAGGIADYSRGTDLAFVDVFNRADAIMYENKLAMKRQLNRGNGGS